MNTDSLIAVEWPVHDRVHACMTTRLGGVSRPPWDSFNLATHVGDQYQQVLANRQYLHKLLSLPNEPRWLEQVHGCTVVDAGRLANSPADASYSNCSGEVCVVLTADCLPVFFSNRAGSEVAVAHAGWRGLADGVLEATLRRFSSPPGDICVWLGAAIGPDQFEVGVEVRQAFVDQDRRAESAFVQQDDGHWLADIYQLARLRLQQRGIESVFGGGLCTVSDRKRFFSYRRDGICGRMASLIWIADNEVA